ncbi:MAG: hypothetical protein C5B51_04405, partial [Terriglobia bacterium]
MEQSREQVHREVEGVYCQYSAALLRYGRSFTDFDGARDAVQEVFLRYFIERTFGRRIENPRAWLYLVLRNYLLVRLKAEQRFAAASPESLAGPETNPEQMLSNSALTRELTRTLTPRERDCLRLRLQGLD